MGAFDEPRPVPGYPEDVPPDRWCCLECVCQIHSEMEAKNHAKLHHECDTPLNGIDYCVGAQLLTLKVRREKWIGEQAAAFGAEMHPGFGAEDFLAEAEIRSA